MSSLSARSDLVRRVLRRAGWQVYSARIAGRRWFFDRLLTPARRAELLAENRRDVDGGEMVTIPGSAGIEPHYGYVVTGRFGLIEESLINSSCVRDSFERQFFSGVPTLRQLVTARRSGRSVPEPMLTVRHVFGDNYHHAVVDCMGTLALFDELPELADLPIVVGSDLAATSVFQAALEHRLVDPSRIIVQDRWLDGQAGVTFARHEFLSAHSLHRTARYLGRMVPDDAADEDVKLYVARGVKGFGRALRNEAELVDELARRGFVVVDPGGLPWTEQYRLFRSAAQVVGVHGAALTNILFRRSCELHVFEMVAPGHRAEAYEVMAQRLGFEYARTYGAQPSTKDNRASFVVDVDEVLRTVDAW